MKIGLSTYSLGRAVKAGEMDQLEVVDWIADNGGEHVEVVIDLSDNDELTAALVSRAAERNLDISSYTIPASFLQGTDEALQAEIERVKRQVDVANALGAKLMRHDAASRPADEATVEQFEKDLPAVVTACQQVADHAKQYGITTSVENHGLHMQSSERVQRLVLATARDNFRTTIDVGNFLCADEDPVIGVKNNITFASLIHMKDFYVRSSAYGPGEGWFTTKRGRFLRGAIVGHGDVDMPAVMKTIKESGYDGYLTIEFEGMEDCRLGSRLGMEHTRRLWDSV